MPYCQLFYHLVWSTKNRRPLLTAEVEPIIYGFMRAKAVALDGTVFALNGTVDHVHMVVSIPPKIAVATFIGQVKGVASARYNKEHPAKGPFFWQSEYGVFTFDAKRLPNVMAYVERQKEHHSDGTTIPILERDHGEWRQPVIREPSASYLDGDASWRDEMLALTTEDTLTADL